MRNPKAALREWGTHVLIILATTAWLVVAECYAHLGCAVRVSIASIIILASGLVTKACRKKHERRIERIEEGLKKRDAAREDRLRQLIAHLPVFWITFQTIHADKARSIRAISLFTAWILKILDDPTADAIAWAKHMRSGETPPRVRRLVLSERVAKNDVPWHMTPATMFAHLSQEDASRILEQLRVNATRQEAIDNLCTPEDEERIEGEILRRNGQHSFFHYVPESWCQTTPSSPSS